MTKIIKLALILMVICVISAGLLAKVYHYTQPLIERNAQEKLERFRQEVLAGQVGQAVLASPRGYSGLIDLLVGVNPSGKVIKVKVLNHRETPGLGSNIVKDKFLLQFSGRSQADKLEPKQDIDAITGATISSRAVCEGIKQVLKTVDQPQGEKL
ncbi:hypothetical protein A3H38_04935 [candidate division WOR-1 bacterium RIFCSPLOWO2_02_FULL_46_20]|uniref:Ion-translocating oxidoreductase complex subunit G n=2 Tax=Saganbacteria TaxID=1703751 RepID=A0A1F4R663_UNCSA|nr:MAG: hypothetical protein A3J44_05810 [candidate division WOR-1 bacterium RIFCSPHIGHO2_02_FULL_45_12]OGC02933.1 MAG: hypothetical protein A3H38_04935 [candidate division WOR-1 bacterium RIFCSPLOWO2_02_FULL_46_20]OGC08562.1 MAG: hypothetical protein A3F86_04895 [candidate division WOR-1 bacterium RIFCSPLOWO2_12_FULL_45_9]